MEAATRLSRYGPNALDALRPLSRVGVLMNQVRSPLLLLLIFAAAASGFTGEWFDAGIVLTIVVATVAVGYSREYSAQAAVDALRARVHIRTQVMRDGRVGLWTRGDRTCAIWCCCPAGRLVPARRPHHGDADIRPRRLSFALSPLLLATIAVVTLAYVAATELVKGGSTAHTIDV